MDFCCGHILTIYNLEFLASFFSSSHKKKREFNKISLALLGLGGLLESLPDHFFPGRAVGSVSTRNKLRCPMK